MEPHKLTRIQLFNNKNSPNYDYYHTRHCTVLFSKQSTKLISKPKSRPDGQLLLKFTFNVTRTRYIVQFNYTIYTVVYIFIETGFDLKFRTDI